MTKLWSMYFNHNHVNQHNLDHISHQAHNILWMSKWYHGIHSMCNYGHVLSRIPPDTQYSTDIKTTSSHWIVNYGHVLSGINTFQPKRDVKWYYVPTESMHHSIKVQYLSASFVEKPIHIPNKRCLCANALW